MIHCNQCQKPIKHKFWYNAASRIRYVFCSVVCYDRFWNEGMDCASSIQEVEDKEHKLEGGWDEQKT